MNIIMIDYNLNEQFQDLVQRILGEQESNNNNSNKDKTTKKTTMCQSKAQIPFKIVTLLKKQKNKFKAIHDV